MSARPEVRLVFRIRPLATGVRSTAAGIPRPEALAA